MRTLVLNFPENFNIDEVEVKMMLASGLYKKGKLTLKQAATLVGLSKSAFRELLIVYAIDVINFSPEELERDLENARDFSQ